MFGSSVVIYWFMVPELLPKYGGIYGRRRIRLQVEPFLVFLSHQIEKVAPFRFYGNEQRARNKLEASSKQAHNELEMSSKQARLNKRQNYPVPSTKIKSRK